MLIRSLIVVLVAMALHGAGAQGASYPTKPIKLVVPFPAGGTSDIAGRVMAQVLGQRLGENVIVDNRPGAGGTLGSDQAVRSPADGYTLLLMAAGPITVGPSIYKAFPFDVQRDLAPIAIIAAVPNIITIHPSIPAADLTGFIAYVKSRRGSVNYASSGNGSLAHLAGELMKQLAGIEMAHIPYRGTAPALSDIVAGQVQLLIDNMPPAMPFVRSGALRALAVTSKARSPAAPDVPTAEEAGLPGYIIESWTGLAAPGGTPEAIIMQLYEALRDGLGESDAQRVLLAAGAEVNVRSPQESRQIIDADTKRWHDLALHAQIRVD